ncbi:MAG: HlyC/CorC family transporter [Acidimicrobiales bacterium]|jgi:putative hemolysin|nr:HlyC/CorC family transporter [Acidimicrobiales bacterium]HLV89880.1 hemolysin family protein [Acidimicrobiia bacterium]
MSEIWPQLTLIAVLILVNAVFAGTELALVSLREGQLQRLETRGPRGVLLARLARDPNRFLATIQIVITLSGFFASASAAVTLSEPVAAWLDFMGRAAGPVSIVLVTLVISYLTLVLGELAPKRLAMQNAETWGLLMARPLTVIAGVSKPLVWLLSRSSDLVVRLLGGDPSRLGEEVTREEIRELIITQTGFTPQQQVIISGALDISERSLRELLRPRREVVTIDADASAEAGLQVLLDSGHSRAPVAERGDLDNVVGVVHLRDLVGQEGPVTAHASEPLFFPETASALAALRVMQQRRQHLAIVISEHGSGEGIITIEDLLEELVGEIYDEYDRDIITVERRPDGTIDLPGRFPVHDLIDLGIDVPTGEYATVAGMVLDVLGRLPKEPGDTVVVGDWEATVLGVEDRALTRIRLRRLPEPEDE